MLTGTNTFSSLLSGAGANIPAFQSLFNYVLMAIVWSSVCWYKYGFKAWINMIYKRGWKCKHPLNPSCSSQLIISDFILSFFDVEGNYFTVLGYRYTTILR
jgi:solute carrier family 35 protein F1/2